jgi:hypothetical protein
MCLSHSGCTERTPHNKYFRLTMANKTRYHEMDAQAISSCLVCSENSSQEAPCVAGPIFYNSITGTDAWMAGALKAPAAAQEKVAAWVTL